MTPTHAKKGTRRYRYYVSQAVVKGRETGSITRVPAPEIEALVIGRCGPSPQHQSSPRAMPG
jgi:hypothetical protein